MASFLELLLQAKPKLDSKLERVEGVSFAGFGIKLRPSRQGLIDLLKALKGKVLVLDEAQELRRSKHRFDSILAYTYDHLDLRIVVSGSQVGLLYRFLGLDDPEAPLFGRPYVEVKVPRLKEYEALRFLEEGFRQHGMSPSREVLEKAVDAFDGIVGWLSYFGYMAVSMGRADTRLIDKVMKDAGKLALSEFEHAMFERPTAAPRYKEIMKIVSALGEARWSEVRRGVEARLGRVPGNTLVQLLSHLVDMGFLERTREGTYRVADPVLRRAFSGRSH